MLTQCTGTFVYSNGTFTEVYPSESNTAEMAAISLKEFCEDVGVSENLKRDRAPEFCGRQSQFRQMVQKKGIELTHAKPERKNQIYKVDIELRELRKRWHNKMRSKGVLQRLWDFGLKHLSKIIQHIPHDQLTGRTLLE